MRFAFVESLKNDFHSKQKNKKEKKNGIFLRFANDDTKSRAKKKKNGNHTRIEQTSLEQTAWQKRDGGGVESEPFHSD